jgi:hypothetical protein
VGRTGSWYPSLLARDMPKPQWAADPRQRSGINGWGVAVGERAVDVGGQALLQGGRGARRRLEVLVDAGGVALGSSSLIGVSVSVSRGMRPD